MEARGFRVRTDEAGNAIGEIGAGERHIVLLGHIDTVPGRIPVRIDGDTLHGRGAVDAKGPLCTFVAAAALAAPRLKARVTVVGAVGEERIGSPGATAVAKWPAPDACIIGEPSGWDAVCLGYRGTLSLHYRLRQPSRHMAGPGESAAEATTTFTSITPTLRSMHADGDGLHDEAHLSIGVRLPPGVEPDALLARLRELAGDATLDVDGAQPGYRSDKRSPLVAPFLRAIRGEGGQPRFTVKLGTSDMTVVGPVWRCPIVAYGPGDASLDHTPQERIELADYARAIRVLATVLEAL
jgi:LysW-gamma-L-lysine carboxypeptidase